MVLSRGCFWDILLSCYKRLGGSFYGYGSFYVGCLTLILGIVNRSYYGLLFGSTGRQGPIKSIVICMGENWEALTIDSLLRRDKILLNIRFCVRRSGIVWSWKFFGILH